MRRPSRRFAFESLENRISPAALAGGLVVAVAVATGTNEPNPQPGTGLPPDNPPADPTTGPGGPA